MSVEYLDFNFTGMSDHKYYGQGVPPGAAVPVPLHADGAARVAVHHGGGGHGEIRHLLPPSQVAA